MPKKIAALLAIIIFFDRLLKAAAAAGLFSAPLSLAGDWFRLYFIRNFNIAFSLPASGWPLEIIIFIIIFAVTFYLVKLYLNKDYKIAGCLAFVLLGAASNFFDRIKYGYVIDYLDVKYFTVFNLADVMIAGGVAGLIYYFKKER